MPIINSPQDGLLRKIENFVVTSLNLFYRPSLTRDALFLSTASIVSGLGSLIYWKLITLNFDASTVGLVSAAITSAIFLGSLANLGITAGLVRFWPEQNAEERASNSAFAYLSSTVTALLVGLLFLGGKQWWAPSLIPNDKALLYMIIFFVLLLSIAQLNIIGAILQAARHSQYLIIQSMAINIIQIISGVLISNPIGVFSGLEIVGILFSYTLPIVIMALGFYIAIPRLLDIPFPKLELKKIPFADFLRYSLGSQLFNLIWILPAFIFPIIVLEKLGAASNAKLSIAWYAYGFLAIIPYSITVALIVSSSYIPDQLGVRLREALVANFAIVLPMTMVSVLFAPGLLGIFGEYYSQASLLLRLLAISIVPVSVNLIYLSIWRVRKQILRLNIFTLTLTGGAMFLSYMLIDVFGLDGIGWGWLIGQTIFAVAITPAIFRECWPATKRIVE